MEKLRNEVLLLKLKLAAWEREGHELKGEEPFYFALGLFIGVCACLLIVACIRMPKLYH